MENAGDIMSKSQENLCVHVEGCWMNVCYSTFCKYLLKIKSMCPLQGIIAQYYNMYVKSNEMITFTQMLQICMSTCLCKLWHFLYLSWLLLHNGSYRFDSWYLQAYILDYWSILEYSYIANNKETPDATIVKTEVQLFSV